MTEPRSREALREVVLVRHAAATGQEPEAPLSAEGRRQAGLLAELLLPLGLERIVASPFRRALESVEPLAARSGLRLETDPRLAERVLSERSLADWREQLRRSFQELDLCLEGGESSRCARARGVAAVLAASAGTRRCAVVTHGNLLALILGWVDPTVGYEQWSLLSNPDVFLVQLDGQRPREFRRLWGSPAAAATAVPTFPHLDDLRRAYDGDAAERNGLQELQWRTGVLERWLQELPPRPRLLELGPGTGQLALHAQGLGASVTALDLSPQNVGYCRQRGVSAQVGDLRALAQLEALGQFDGIYAINCLLHVPRAEHPAVVAGMRRRLVPGGSVLIASWGGPDWEGVWPHDRCAPARFFSHYDDARFQALTFAGFQVVRRELLSDFVLEELHPQVLVLRGDAAEAREPTEA